MKVRGQRGWSDEQGNTAKKGSRPTPFLLCSQDGKARRGLGVPKMAGDDLHRTGLFGIRSGRHTDASGSLGANCCCNGSVGFDRHNGVYLISDTCERGSSSFVFVPAFGGFKT